MNPHDAAIVRQFKDRVNTTIPSARMILFGSRARGDAEADSDMDVVVLVPEKSRTVDDVIQACAWEVGFQHGLHVSAFVYSESDWQSDLRRESLLGLARISHQILG